MRAAMPSRLWRGRSYFYNRSLEKADGLCYNPIWSNPWNSCPMGPHFCALLQAPVGGAAIEADGERIMNRKEIAEIRRRLNPEQNAISCVRGCYVNEKREIVSVFTHSLL